MRNLRVYLDTNVIMQANYLGGTSILYRICTLAQNHGFEIYIPKVVLDESSYNLEKKINDCHLALRREYKTLSKIMGHEFKTIDLEGVKEHQKKLFQRRIHNLGIKIINYPKTTYEELIASSYREIKPFKPNNKGDGFKDYLIWESIKGEALNQPTKEHIFISQNLKDFGDDDKNLHPSLLEQLGKYKENFSYFSNTQDFLNKVIVPRLKTSMFSDEDTLDKDTLIFRTEELTKNALVGSYINRLRSSPLDECYIAHVSQVDLRAPSEELTLLDDDTITIELEGVADIEMQGHLSKSDWAYIEPGEYDLDIIDAEHNRHVMTAYQALSTPIKVTVSISRDNLTYEIDQLSLTQELTEDI